MSKICLEVSIFLLLLTGAIVQPFSLKAWRSKRAQRKRLQAPKFADFPSIPLLGVVRQIDKDAIGCLGAHVDYARSKHLPAVGVPLGVLGTIYLLLEPKAIQSVMEDRSDIMYKSDLDRRGVGLMTGKGILLTDGPAHTRKRRIVLPALSESSSLDYFLSVMVNCTNDVIEELRQQEESSNSTTSFDVLETMSALAMRIVSLCLFSTDVVKSGKLGSDIVECLNHVVYVSRHPFAPPQWIPTRRNRQFKKAKQNLDDLCQRLINVGRTRLKNATTKDTPSDLLTMLLQARYEDDESKGLNDQELKDEVLTLFLAGHETTANALAWTCWFLSAPDFEQYQRLMAHEGQQVETVNGYSPGILQDYDMLKYTRGAICEALRLRGPSWAIDREVQADVDLPGDLHFRKGDLLLLAPFFQHLDSEVFGLDYLEFKPQRFIEKNPAKGKDIWDGPFPRNVYMPFGAGRKRCVGFRLAQWEMLVVMSTLMKNFRLRRPVDGEIDMIPGITLRPEEGFRLTLERVAGTGASPAVTKEPPARLNTR